MAGKCQIVHTVKKDKMGSPGELHTGPPNRSLPKDYKENISGNHFQANKGQQ